MKINLRKPGVEMNFIKRLFCAHDWQFVRNIYGDEIYEFGGDRSVWRCSKCGKVESRHQFVQPAKNED